MATKTKDVWRYSIGTDRIREEDLQRILQIWKDNPDNKVTYLGKLKKEFEVWAKQQGAKETDDGYFSLTGN